MEQQLSNVQFYLISVRTSNGSNTSVCSIEKRLSHMMLRNSRYRRRNFFLPVMEMKIFGFRYFSVVGFHFRFSQFIFYGVEFQFSKLSILFRVDSHFILLIFTLFLSVLVFYLFCKVKVPFQIVLTTRRSSKRHRRIKRQRWVRTSLFQ